MSSRPTNPKCPGTDVILELLRAEHEQVKRRTDIIKQLISYNCLPKVDAPHSNSHSSDSPKKDRNNSPSKNELMKSMNKINKDVENLIQIKSNQSNQTSDNNRESRHSNCFPPYYGSLNIEKPNRLEINALYSRLSQGSVRLLSSLKHEDFKPNLPTYSAVQKEDLNRKSLPPFPQFKNEILIHSTPKKIGNPNESSLPGYSPKKTGNPNDSHLPPNSKGIPNKNIKPVGNFKGKQTSANQTEGRNNDYDMNRTENHDYRFEAYRLLQEVTDLKIAARKYEEEKSEWVYEKRQQIRILQELRDASCEETKAAMELTSWKPSDIECNPAEYEESKRKWLLCKKHQIELLEKLRGVSLCEIKRSIQKISVPEVMDINCSKYDDNNSKSFTELTELSKPYSQELFNSDSFSVRICSPTEKNDHFEKDKININIMMKSNSNVFKVSPSISELSDLPLKGSPFKSSKSNLNNSGLFIERNFSMIPFNEISNFESKFVLQAEISRISPTEKSDSTSMNSNLIDQLDDVPIDEMKKTIENKIGRKLFQNTYNILTQLNCPELILQSTNGDAQIAEIVFNYIIQERKCSSQSSKNLISI